MTLVPPPRPRAFTGLEPISFSTTSSSVNGDRIQFAADFFTDDGLDRILGD
ncbi:hypothetical protein [Nocardia tengchongensis]|uniref:hypothetical protein n=1 Tax=Nocardia tengchongensis TaxID=2055889 RepID=UPI003660FF74